MQWNTGLYDQKHDFVSKYGEDVIHLLNPQAGEHILDLGLRNRGFGGDYKKFRC